MLAAVDLRGARRRSTVPPGDGLVTEFATINGYELRYRLEGEGPLVVFGHGLMGSIEQVDPLEGGGALEYVLERVKLLIYDARGHGQSGGPEDANEYT